MIKNIVLMTLMVASIMACKDSARKATIYTKQSEAVATVDSEQDIDAIVATWQSKQRALEKLMPLFEYKVEMDVDGEKQVWLFNKAGYLMKEGSSELYKVKDSSALTKHLN
ncbi:hypothetical protein [Kangiella sp. TOML190]|uniref:hypothetical protein n=1 Tax=Kangiella sp. TOML190 TaxID=2931351 RepID=UPI00203C1D03|nr:hypothetical protein [Kangiella sp. TOML190]